MPWLRECILNLEVSSPPAEAFQSIKNYVQESGFEIIESNPEKGEITFACLHKLMNVALWVCWGDKVLVVIQARPGAASQIAVFGLPELLRYKVRKGEKAYSKTELSNIFKEIFAQP